MSYEFTLYGKNENYRLLDESAPLLELFAFAKKYAVSGNLRQILIAYLLATDENPYSLSVEMGEPNIGSLSLVAKKDMEIFYSAFHESPSGDFAEILKNFTYEGGEEENEDHRIGKLLCAFANELGTAKNADEFFQVACRFYTCHGVGDVGLYRAFHFGESTLSPLSCFSNVSFDDLWGYDLQKEALFRNTDAFLAGEKANNVLLYGDAGTGKSTSVQALLNKYYDKGLRMVEVYRHEMRLLPNLLNILKNRRHHFILFLDDLSFEDFETEYKYLKAVIEGGMEPRPKNVLIYATSNRRHLVRESWKDRSEEGEELHPGDTVQEKLSLSDRFGLSLHFGRPDQNDYFEIVRFLAHKEGLSISDEDLLKKARAFAVRHGNMSGRVAEQFIAGLSE